MYKLFLDKNEIFEASIEIEGGSIKDTKCRLMLESKEWNLHFPASIDYDGKITASIKKLKDVLKEGDTGKLTLEVIVEDTWFTPWEDSFEVNVSKKVVAEVKQSTPEQSSKGISIVVNPKYKAEEPTLAQIQQRFIQELQENNITDIKSLHSNKKILNEISEKYIEHYSIKNSNSFIKESLQLLLK